MSTNLYVTSGDAYSVSGADDRRLLIAVTDPSGAAVDLTGVDLTFMVKRQRYDNDAAAVFTKITPSQIAIASPQTGATKGKAHITLLEADTEDLASRYFWELQADDAVGKLTLADGKLYVRADLIEG